MTSNTSGRQRLWPALPWRPILRGTVVLVSALVTIAGLNSGSVVRAVQFHYFSSAIENSAGTTYTANYVHRYDESVSGIPHDGCSAHYAGSPVYQTEWLRLGTAASDAGWLELGTGHQCQDQYRYWFWGWGGASGTWYPLGEQDGISDGSTHNFKIIMDQLGGSYIAQYEIDQTVEGSLTGLGLKGYQVTAILESWASTASTLFDMSQLQYQTNFGSWTQWAGRDAKNVDSTYMCGKWLTDNDFRSGQPSTVC